MKSASELENTVREAWREIKPPDSNDLKFLGENASIKLAGIRPIDVDLNDDEFSSVNLLLDFKPLTAAAYFGAYLLNLLESFQIQEKIGFPVDIAKRADIIGTFTYPTFWTEVANPNLPLQCLTAVGEVAEFMVCNRQVFFLTDDHVEALQHISKSARRAVGVNNK